MKDGTKNKTMKGQRQIVSVSLTLPVADALEQMELRFNINRSKFICEAIAEKLNSLGLGLGVREP